MSAIVLEGTMLHYEALGRGRPIVFLHGWVGSWRYWINAMQVASTSFRAYALDLLGFGDTQPIGDPNPLKYSVEEQTILLDRFLAEMGIGKIAIVGHGLGALVGFNYIRKFPRSVDRIMAVNCPIETSAVNAKLWTVSMTDAVDWLSTRTPEAVSALSDISRTRPAAVSASMTGLQTDGLFSSVREANVPCLLVYGQNDPAITFPIRDTDGTPSLVHQMVLDDAGHFPMIEDPFRFNRLMTDFLALESGISPTELQFKEEWKRRVR